MAIAELVVKLIGDVSGFQKSMDQVGKTVSRTGKSITSAGEALSKTITLPMLGIAGASLKLAGDFQASMSKVSALGEITGNDLKKLESQALELGASTQFSAKQAADGMAELASAGFKTEEIYNAMPGVLDLAAAGQISVAEAAGVAAATIGQFNLDASESTRVADVLARGAAEGALTISDLGTTMKYVGPVAKTLGQSLEETVSAITLLSNAGIKGSDAGTALRMGLVRMVKPTKQAQEVIDKLGLQLTTSEGKVRPFVEVIQELKTKQASLADVTKLVGTPALSSWIALINQGPEKLAAMNEKMASSEGAAKQMAAILRDNLYGSFEQMSGAIETLGIAIGMALTPAARSIMGAVQSIAESAVSFVEAFRSLNQNTQNAIIAFLGVVTVAGPVAFAIGKIITVVGGMIKAMAAAKTAAALMATTGGIGLIVVAIGAAVAAVVYFKDDIIAAFDAAWSFTKDFASWFWDTFTNIGSAVVEGFSIAIDYISEWASRIYDVIYAALDIVLALFGTSFEEIGQTISLAMDAAAFVFNNFGTICAVALDSFLMLFGLNTSQMLEIWNVVWDGAKLAFTIFQDACVEVMNGLLSVFTELGSLLVSVWTSAMNGIRDIFVTVFDTIITGLGYAETVIGAFSERGETAISNLRKALEEMRKPVEVTTEKVTETKLAVDDLSKAVTTQEKAVEKDKKKIEELSGANAKTTKATKDLDKATNSLAGSTDKSAKATSKKTKEEKEAEKAAKAAAKANEDLAEKIQELVEGNTKYEQTLKKIRDGAISAEDANKELGNVYAEAARLLNDYNVANENYQRLLQSYASGENVQVTQVQEIVKAYDEAKQKLDEFSDTQDQLFKGDGKKGGKTKGIEDVFKMLFGVDLGDAFGEELANTISNSIGEAIKLAFSGGHSEDYEKLASSAATTAIASLADAWLGEGWGAIVEDWFGPLIDGLFEGMFGKESAGTTARKSADKFFAEVFDENRLGIIVNGQLVKIRDLVFKGDTLFGGEAIFGEADSTFANFFQSLPPMAREAFGGVGAAFEELLGVGEDISGQLGAVFANNVGASLNNLQLLVYSTGKSFEELRSAVMEAFLDGKLSALEAQSALNGINQIATKGIPDGIGMTIQAFENLKAAGVRGGRALIDALEDMGFEAKELGLKTLPELMNNLLQSGKFTQKEIDMVFQAMRDHGINSVEDLTNATQDQLLAVLSQLQAQEFPFADAASDAEDLVEEINKLPPKKDLQFNIKTNFDENTKKAMQEGYVPNNQGEHVTQTSPKPNAKGNVFSSGAVLPFAKGGVVGQFTMFDIGSMAERGPEAIMPLERLPDGRLGVLSATNSKSDTSVVHNITINAPYAMPGVSETIRREIDKYFDTKNRLPGIRR